MSAPTRTPARPVPAPPQRSRTPMFALPETRWAAAALALFLAGLAAQLAGAPPWTWWTLYLACYVTGGWEPGLAGLRALRDRTLDVDLLMVAAAIGAAAIGQITDGALLIVIFATSGALEAIATARTEDSVRGLLDLAPDTATRVVDGAEQTVRAADLEIGDEVLVRPGERIAADGTVVSGGSDVDQATITGEPLPVGKTAGDEVFAGTSNGTGTLRIRVDRRAADSVVARIAAMVEEAVRTKARTQLFIEKVEQRYSVGMVVATLAVFAVPMLLGDTLQRALLRAMTFMIVASPCAVVLATMPPLLAAIATAGRHGVLVKSAVVMERLGTTTRVAFDKTGTLTRGVPRVAELHVLDAAHSPDEVLRLAAAAEHPSEHPLAAAVVGAARERGLRLPPAADFVAVPGRGVAATVAGKRVEVGSPAGIARPAPQLAASVGRAHDAGHTAVVVRCDEHPIGVLEVADQLRSEAPAAVAATAALTDAPPLLMTGDNHATATRVGAATGIGDVHAELLPEDKVELVRAQQAAGHTVAMVGDGINDAPALATADLGIAMGGAGSDLALRTADAIVVHDDLTTVPAVIALSQRARRVVVANLTIAASFIVVLVAWDLLGTLPLPLGVAGHEGSTILVALNGLRLLRGAAWDRAARTAT
ncbi:heavy metal translocating P-type ATPase [Nocardia farcinica]|uniref:heavy metal translocating P-type ATPase n=2 Tax=Nocardia farcinica TaxID=37329 RepID=UPI00189618C9|nr:heavy metal translocating P-type ATPase [Nocardia farcinica]MBF6521065.1 cadmium-translocating P-type ATPase [Nocardia farcinica]